MKRVVQQSILAVFVMAAAACASRAGVPAAAPAMDQDQAAVDHGPPAAAAHDEHAHHGAHDLPATAGPGFTVADVQFMQHMIVHHMQALIMAELAPARGARDRLLRLAQKIEISQHDEIALMERWLEERGQAVPDEGHLHTMRMPGMLTAAQLAELEAARGLEFERLFLLLMIQHHAGALDMVDALFAAPGAAQDPDIFRFATDVATDQADEIGVMQSMLGSLEDTTGSASR